MKGSSRLDVVSAGGPGMETVIRNSLKKRFTESTNLLVKKLGEDWVSTSEGATTGHRSDDIGVTVSVYGGVRGAVGYRVKLDTVNANSQKNFPTTQECSDSIVSELATISRICTELANKLLTAQQPTTPQTECPTDGPQSSADNSADEQ